MKRGEERVFNILYWIVSAVSVVFMLWLVEETTLGLWGLLVGLAVWLAAEVILAITLGFVFALRVIIPHYRQLRREGKI